MSETILFGLDWIQLFTIAGVLVAVLIHFFPQLLQRFKGYKDPIGESYWHYKGTGGSSFNNVKLEEAPKLTSFTSQNGVPIRNVHLKEGVDLPNVNIDENDSKCNAIIVKTWSTHLGIVDVYTCIDAHGQETPWDNAFLSNYSSLLAKAREDLIPIVKKQELDKKEFGDSLEGNDFAGLGWGNEGGKQK